MESPFCLTLVSLKHAPLIAMADADGPDPTQPSLEGFSAGGHSFSIPWSHDVRVLLCGFQTSKMKKTAGPWVASHTAFDTSAIDMTSIIPDTQGGSTSYKDGLSTSSTTSYDHLSASLGITIGYPFLSGSVTGEYDKTVMDSRNVCGSNMNPIASSD